LQSQAEKAGVAPERSIFGSPCSPKLEHLKRVTLADLALDTLVYNGHTTASDMLWAGVPLITMRGDNWPSLVASSIAQAVKMGEMVVEDLEEYEERAVDLALNKLALTKLKAKMAGEVWRRYAADEADGDIVVKDMKPVRPRPLDRLCIKDIGPPPQSLDVNALEVQVDGSVSYQVAEVKSHQGTRGPGRRCVMDWKDVNTTDQGVKCLIKSSNTKRAMCWTWSTEASEAESRAQRRPAQAAPSAKKLFTRPFLPLTTSGRGETAAPET
jgi:hypothetical protein